MGIDYLKVINLIKQKKILENTSDQFDPTAVHQAHFYDIDKAERMLELKAERAQAARGETVDEMAETAAQQRADEYDQSLETKIKQDKKAQAREQLKIIK